MQQQKITQGAGMEVLVRDTDCDHGRNGNPGATTRFLFKQWLRSCQSFVFTKGWNDYAERKGLRVSDVVIFWWDTDVSMFSITYLRSNGYGRPREIEIGAGAAAQAEEDNADIVAGTGTGTGTGTITSNDSRKSKEKKNGKLAGEEPAKQKAQQRSSSQQNKRQVKSQQNKRHKMFLHCI